MADRAALHPLSHALPGFGGNDRRIEHQSREIVVPGDVEFQLILIDDKVTRDDSHDLFLHILQDILGHLQAVVDQGELQALLGRIFAAVFAE